MTKLQIEFLKLLNKRNMTSIELCQKLNISPDKNDVGGYYNALNRSISYLTSDEKGELDDYFEILFDNTTNLGDELYHITNTGKQFLKHRFIKKTLVGVILTSIVIIIILLQLFK